MLAAGALFFWATPTVAEQRLQALTPPLKTRGGQKRPSSWSAHLPTCPHPPKTVMPRHCACAF
jgi:hypothetical protein